MSIEEIIKELEGFQEIKEGISKVVETQERKAHYKERAQALKEAIALLRTHQDNQQGKPKMDGWISVDDGRPEYCENVLVYYAGDGIKYPRVDISFRLYDEFILESVYGPVTHWRPLPDPPKEE